MGQRIIYYLVRLLISVIELLPFWVLYRISDGLYGLVYHVLGYRKKVVRDNIRHAFPKRDKTELRRIERQFYRFLIDVMLESLKGFSLSEKVLHQRLHYTTLPILKEQFKGRSVLIVGGHYGNWEWGALSASFQASSLVTVLYEPLQNPYLEDYIRRSRERFDAQLCSGREAMRVFGQRADQPTTFVLIADQSPSNPGRAYWLPFLNQDTPVLRGPAIFAHRYDLPLLYLSIRRVKRGYYEMSLEVLTESPRAYTPEALIRLYWARLEQEIEAQPAHWLWSHRRWKHRRG